MKNLKLLALASLLSGFSIFAHAEVNVTDAWVRATVAQQKATGAFLTIQSDQAVRLISATATDIPVVQIHKMEMQGDVMKMREVDGIDIPAGKAVELKPGGYHLMFLDLNKALPEGAKVPLSLKFEGKDKKIEEVKVQAIVKGMTKSHSSHAGHH